jgi:hypothetical protein
MASLARHHFGQPLIHVGDLCSVSMRGSRVIALTLLLGVLNVWDLWVTITVYQAGMLCEANPIASYVLDTHGVIGISLFKTTFVTLAVGGFLLGRCLLLAEIGCVATTAVYLVVAWLWTIYPAVQG